MSSDKSSSDRVARTGSTRVRGAGTSHSVSCQTDQLSANLMGVLQDRSERDKVKWNLEQQGNPNESKYHKTQRG
jgi:hypothetical protein